jgi:tripartite-type tricarboxylate transporter receptor subunit TctC
MFGSRKRLSAVLVLAATVLVALYISTVRAQDYPSRPVRVVVPFSAGGAVDGPMRVIAQELSKRQTNAISATLYPKLSYDPIEDFVPISLIGREPGVLVVHPSLPVKTFQEFVAYVKERPGQVDYASSGNGSGQHLFVALLASMTGMKMNHVPYRGSAQATADLLGGQVQVSIPGTAGMVGHIKAGKLRALAVTGAKRSPQLPDVPTVMESGVPGYEAYVWMGLLAPKGTPAPIIDKVLRELMQVLATNEVKTYMASAGIEIVGSTPAEFGAFFRSEKELWAKVIRETGAKID